MEWYIMNASGVRGLTSGLATKISEEVYKINDECEESIETLLEKIETDDPNTSVTKRHLLTEQIVTRDLIPILKYTVPDINELQLVLKLLSALGEPVNEEQTTRGGITDTIRHDMQKLGKQVRNAFLDIRFVSRLFEQIHELIDEAGELEMSPEGYEVIYNSLRLIRNVLYYAVRESSIKQTALYGLLMKYNLSSIMLFSIHCHHKQEMAMPVSQILSLLFKNFQWDMPYSEQLHKCEEEIAAAMYVNNKLKCLIVSLLQGPLSSLLVTLKNHELSNMKSESSGANYLTWCIAYFVPHLNRVNISLSKISGVISTSFVGFLVYKLSVLSMRMLNSTDAEACKEEENRMYLTFAALETILNVAMSYKLSSLDDNELKTIMQFYKDIVQMSDLWQILLFYIRNFEITRFPRSFLSQLVSLNHNMLTIIELYTQMSKTRIDHTVLSHIQQFASPQVIGQYSLLVQSYATNSGLTNMAVFTMLSHVCVECEKMESLYSPELLRALGNISGYPNATSEDIQFAEYVTRSFLDDLSIRPKICVDGFMRSTNGNTEPITEDNNNMVTEDDQDMSYTADWTDEEESDLFSAFADASSAATLPDMVELVTDRLRHLGIQRTQADVHDKLVQYGLIEGDNQQDEDVTNNVSDLVDQMKKNGNSDFVSWLHNGLVTASYVKAMPKDKMSKLSPICRYSVLHEHDYPLIPYSERLEKLMRVDNQAQQLTDALGLSCHSYIPLISQEKSAGQLYAVAESLKPVLTLPHELEVYTNCSTSSSSSTSGDSIEWEGQGQKISSEPLGRFGANLPASNNSMTGVNENLWLNYMRMNSANNSTAAK